MRPIGAELVTTIMSPSCLGTHILYLSNPPSGNLLPIIPWIDSLVKQSSLKQPIRKGFVELVGELLVRRFLQKEEASIVLSIWYCSSNNINKHG